MKYLFEENQKFTQWWLWVILLSFPIMSFGPFDENEINIKNRSYFSTVMGLAFRKLDVFGYYKFVTAVKNINLLPNRDNMIAQKKAKAVSSFAFKGVIGIVAIIYIALFGFSFWQITELNKKIVDYDQIVQEHELKTLEKNKYAKEIGVILKSAAPRNPTPISV